MMLILGWIIVSVLNWLLITTLINCRLMGLPIPALPKKHDPPEHLVTTRNRIDIQTNFECSAYSAAYLMRHYGIQASGEEIYKIMPYKIKSGYVYPKGIITLLKQQGFKATLHTGNIGQLKKEVSKNTPVIVFIKVNKNQNYLHFVPVIGYDEDYLYFAESLNELVNVTSMEYNRKVSISEFKELWNISELKMPLYRNIYITVSSNLKLH
ncbi:C39 family peptidase [Paenibacillus sp. MMS20-IR301]|uniref:C39 family peptidase n=1 Tax=Paenibacillus sp. MMS20-IR301 TaxID=2895946 RepID=UPI0028F09193|nr:C39 family peptidase [Paenibacillus sp. MMS20-IR301]WNS44614.1 C39 family peptidase [Paenibacillus sp. MMS20-IR301]